MSFIAAAVIGGIGVLGASAISTFGGKGGKRPTFDLGDFPEDPFVGKAQETLFPFGERLLAGDIPDFFAPIGEIGGETFEKFLGMNIRDVQRVIGEDLARRGVRGPRGSKILAETTADVTTSLRFQDLLKGIEGRKFLLESGANILSGVRGAGLAGQGQKASFEISRGNLALGFAGLELEDTRISDAISSGFGAAGNLFALSQLGDPGSVGTRTAETRIRGSAGAGAFGATQEEINALFRNIRR